MNIHSDEQLLAFCLGDCPDRLQQEIKARMATDPLFCERVVDMQVTTHALRSAPHNRRRRTLQRPSVRLAAFSLVTLGFFLSGMLMQARLNVFAPSELDSTKKGPEVSRAISWEGPSEQIL